MRYAVRLPLLAFGVILFTSGIGLPTLHARTLAEHAGEFERQITGQLLPWWYDRTVDWDRGGYLLSEDARGNARPATEKQLVSQARMIWGFSHAIVEGYRDPKRDYLKAARQGYEFLRRQFRDEINGGYYWKTDLQGHALVDRKYLYGQAFAVYALVEYHRASRDAAPLADALELYRAVQQHAHDGTNGGWGEHFTRDWQLITTQDSQIEVEVAGLKSANAHLHWMEALTELFAVTRDASVRESLAEAVTINRTRFYPPTPGRACFHRHPDWSLVTDPASAGLSYGHNVEFAWLLLRAEEVLGVPPSWTHFRAMLDHAFRYGWDTERGGLYSRGNDDAPATETEKVWWVQAETLAALVVELRERPDLRREQALHHLINFIQAHLADDKTGIWLESVTAEGRPKSTALAHNWKANYHDLRALMLFVDAFRARP